MCNCDFDRSVQKALRLAKGYSHDSGVAYLTQEFMEFGLRKDLAEGLAKDALMGNFEDAKALVKAHVDRAFGKRQNIMFDTSLAHGGYTPMQVVSETKLKGSEGTEIKGGGEKMKKAHAIEQGSDPNKISPTALEIDGPGQRQGTTNLESPIPETMSVGMGEFGGEPEDQVDLDAGGDVGEGIIPTEDTPEHDAAESPQFEEVEQEIEQLSPEEIEQLMAELDMMLADHTPEGAPDGGAPDMDHHGDMVGDGEVGEKPPAVQEEIGPDPGESGPEAPKDMDGVARDGGPVRNEHGYHMIHPGGPMEEGEDVQIEKFLNALSKLGRYAEDERNPFVKGTYSLVKGGRFMTSNLEVGGKVQGKYGAFRNRKEDGTLRSPKEDYEAA